MIEAQASASQPVMPVELGVGTIAHCPIDGCTHIVTAKRQVQAWKSLGAHIVFVHHPEMAGEFGESKA